jgi:hypothetical protein
MYALWYYFVDNTKSTNIVSLNKDSLHEIHKIAISRKDSLYYNYQKYIFKMEIEPIQTYIYKNNTIFIISNEKDLLDIKEGAFYCSYNYDLIRDKNDITNNNLELEEILIYMSKEDHNIWRTNYEENNKNGKSISRNSVNTNEYYEEGIMNA